LTHLRAAVVACVVSAQALAEPGASPVLRPDHWAVRAVERLEALGLVEDWLPAQKSVPILDVADALVRVEAAAREARPDLLALVSGWRERFAQEWPGSAGAAAILGARAGVGAEGGSATEGTPRIAPDALHLAAPRTEPFATVAGAGRLGAHLAAGVDGRLAPSGAALQTVEAVAFLGGWSLSVGRTYAGVGFSEGGGAMLSGAAPLDRVELRSASPFELPWPLRRSGLWSLDVLTARLDPARHPYGGLLGIASVQWRPHPRLTLGAQRGVMFGGAFWSDLSPRDRAESLLGLSNQRDNNMLSWNARWRMPSEAWLPLTATADVGSDDVLAGVKIPGVVAGVSAPMLGSLPATLGVEVAFFGRACCQPPSHAAPWYVHGTYVGGWSTGETPLGDPLGGNGRALRVRAGADPWDGRVALSSMIFVADRFSGNLYAPQAAGRSVGARLDCAVRFGRGALELRGAHEQGDAGWQVTQGSALATLGF
jgi:hypothetical protein